LNVPHRATRNALLTLDVFLGITAVLGGLALLVGWIAPDLGALHGSPFHDYTVPALLLILVEGVAGLAAAWTVHRRMAVAPPVSAVAGCSIVCFEVVELSIIGFNPLQALYMAVGLAIVAAATTLGAIARRGDVHGRTRPTEARVS
jgi:hypothetical protein